MKTIAQIIILSLIAQYSFAQCPVCDSLDNKPKALNQAFCDSIYLNFYGNNIHDTSQFETLKYNDEKEYKVRVKWYSSRDCFCYGYAYASRDSAIKILAIGDPGHVDQKEYNHYAKQGIWLQLTGDIPDDGQSEFNDGYNYFSKKRFGNEIKRYDRNDSSLCNETTYDVKMLISDQITITKDSNHVIITKNEGANIKESLANCKITLKSYLFINGNYESYTYPVNYKMSDLSASIRFDLTELSTELQKSASIYISLENYKNDEFCWTYRNEFIRYPLRHLDHYFPK